MLYVGLLLGIIGTLVAMDIDYSYQRSNTRKGTK